MSAVASSEPESVSPAPDRRRDWDVDAAIALLLGLVATGFRVVELDRPGIWFDESTSYRLIDYPLGELMERTSADCHPPLYWILLGLWKNVFGAAVGALRGLGVLFGVGTVVATYGLVRSLPSLDGHSSSSRDRTAAVLAALLIALSPFHIEWSQEMRMYSLAAFEVVLATWLFSIGLQGGHGATAAWIGYLVVGTASLYTMYFSGFVLAAHGMFVLVRGMTTGAWPLGYFATVLGMWFGFSPWLPVVVSMFGTVQQSFPQGSLTWASFSAVFWRMFVPPNFLAPSDLTSLALILLGGAVVAMLLVARTPQRLLVGLCALVPFQAILSVSLLSQNLVTSHRLILGQLFLLVGWALLIGGIRQPLLRWPLVVVSIQVSLWTAVYYVDFREAKAGLPGMRAAMLELDTLRGPQDPVFFVNPMLYLNGVVYAPHRENVFSAGRRDQFPYYQGSVTTRDSDYKELSEIPADAKVVWTVDAENWFGSRWNVTLPREWELIDESRYSEYYADIVIRMYNRESAP